MTLKKVIIFSFLITSLLSCTHIVGESMNTVLKKYKGKNPNQIVRIIGLPTKIQEESVYSYYTWEQVGTNCVIIVQSKANKVVNIKWKGKCNSKDFSLEKDAEFSEYILKQQHKGEYFIPDKNEIYEENSGIFGHSENNFYKNLNNKNDFYK